jgi:hypothetical protein
MSCKPKRYPMLSLPPSLVLKAGGKKTAEGVLRSLLEGIADQADRSAVFFR